MQTNLIPGSLSAVAKLAGAELAVSFLDADMLVLVDGSASMSGRDVRERPGQTRHQVAADELAKLQAARPGKVAVIAWSTEVRFCPAGVPAVPSEGTDLVAALKFAKPADDCGMAIYVISDGEPDDGPAALALARRFTSPIHTIYIGNAGEAGQAFLAKLATAAGGQHAANSVAQLGAAVQQLQLAAGGGA